MNNYVIKTDRLKLREICETDTEKIVAWRSDPEVYKYFRNPHALTEAEHLQWYQNKYIKDNDMISWIACFEKDPIGVFQAVRRDIETAEVSYLLDKGYQGKGFAAEVVSAIEKWIYKSWNINKLVAEIHVDNEKSREFILRMGYIKKSREGNFDIYIKTLENTGIQEP